MKQKSERGSRMTFKIMVSRKGESTSPHYAWEPQQPSKPRAVSDTTLVGGIHCSPSAGVIHTSTADPEPVTVTVSLSLYETMVYWQSLECELVIQLERDK